LCKNIPLKVVPALENSCTEIERLRQISQMLQENPHA
jgi:hypothetical protein